MRAEVSQWNQVFKAEIDRGQHVGAEMVCGRIAQCTLGLQRTWRSSVLVGTRSDHELLKKTKVEHEELTKMELVTADMFMPDMLWS